MLSWQSWQEAIIDPLGQVATAQWEKKSLEESLEGWVFAHLEEEGVQNGQNHK